MGVNPDFKDLLSELSAADARFIVVGAHAVIHYAAPRFTKDLDVWVDPTQENAPRVWAALAGFGAPLDELSVSDLSTPGTVFQIGIEPNRIDIVTEVTGLSFGSAWEQRVESTYGGVPIAILSIEDLMTNKRAVGRPQDLLDLDHLKRARDLSGQ